MSLARIEELRRRWRSSNDQHDLLALQEEERRHGIRYAVGHTLDCWHPAERLVADVHATGHISVSGALDPVSVLPASDAPVQWIDPLGEAREVSPRGESPWATLQPFLAITSAMTGLPPTLRWPWDVRERPCLICKRGSGVLVRGEPQELFPVGVMCERCRDEHARRMEEATGYSADGWYMVAGRNVREGDLLQEPPRPPKRRRKRKKRRRRR